ncbi:lipoyl(octanoyl) transferase LipB [Pelistega europaea]|uniref:Octanoyltransferase n=1 Tax=Pelistega europaea TaxID=106147 RepID=A0A7Y4L803_9BURK|nr:lipoyl(octanoyl) transferase LipB [Pelistega europaea]NOL48685.1 lipoyl(octanoyl) transferase LipB [Pelistega europaea]
MVQIKRIEGLADYQEVFDAMRQFTAQRTSDTPDEIWQVEHKPVYTLGQAGKVEHILNPHGIPVVRSNRGGQVTYHGPGQVVLYPLINLHRRHLFVREYVQTLEEAVIQTLAQFGIMNAQRTDGAPGVYVPLKNAASLQSDKNIVHSPFSSSQGELAKIAALGVKVSNGCTYHGVALNVKMDLSPFYGINPCGYAGLPTVDMKTMGVEADWQDVADKLTNRLEALLYLR